MAVAQADRLGLKNFSVLVSHVLVPPAIRAVLASPCNRVQAFLAAGHVCTITGMEPYRLLAEEYRVPIVVTGFEPLDILQGLLMCVRQWQQGHKKPHDCPAFAIHCTPDRPLGALMVSAEGACAAYYRYRRHAGG